MKITIEIPDEALEEAMRLTGAKTNREAVVTAIEDFNRRRRLAADLGSFDGLITRDELEQLRLEG